MAAKRQNWTVVSMLRWATQYFKKEKIPDPRFSIEWLLADVLEVKRLDLYLHYDRPLSPKELDTLRPLVKRRASHEPLQYITGESVFMNIRLDVNPNVLIPRTETEQLVEIILEDLPSNQPLSVLDIGTGSGCIAIALKKECPPWHVFGLDKSSEALTMAQKNAKKNETDIQFFEHNILTEGVIAIEEPLDVIVSNPPYVLIEEKKILEPQVVDYEPAEALFCEDIEQMYKNIIQIALNKLKQNGSIYLELHYQQGERILALLDQKKWNARVIKDYDDKPRFIRAKKKK